MTNHNETNEEVHTKQEEISNDSPRVPAVEEEASPRVPESETMPQEKAHENKKGYQIRKEVNISSPQGINKNKADIVNSGLIATRPRSQVRFQPSINRVEEKGNVSGRTRSKLALSTRSIKLSKVLNIVLADCVIDHTSKRCKIDNDDETDIANAALDSETGQIMEFRYLMSHENPKIRAMWSESAANELGRLFQGVGRNNDGSQLKKGIMLFLYFKRKSAEYED